MKFFATLSAALLATGVAALPAADPVSDIAEILTPANIRAVVSAGDSTGTIHTAVERRTYGSLFSSTMSSWRHKITGSETSIKDCGCSNGNPFEKVVDDLIAGGKLSVGIEAILADANLAAHVLDLTANAKFMAKLTKLCTSASFYAELTVLLKSEAFLNKCGGIVADGRFAAQIGLLLSNPKFMAKFAAGLSLDVFIKAVSAHLGASFDFGAVLSAHLSSKAFVSFLVKLCGKGVIGGKLGLLLGDAKVLAQLRALLSLKAGFGLGLGKCLADADFTAHICAVLGLDASLTAKFVALFAANVSFAAQLEALLGVGFKGKFAAFLGAGSFIDLAVGFCGELSFGALIGGAFSGGAFLKAFAKLCLDASFVTKLCGFLGAYISAKIGFVGLVGKIFADKVFAVACLGLFGVKAAVATGLCAVLGGAGIVAAVAGFLTASLSAIIGGAVGFLGKLFGGLSLGGKVGIGGKIGGGIKFGW